MINTKLIISGVHNIIYSKYSEVDKAFSRQFDIAGKK